MPPLDGNGALAPEENERIFRRDILPDYLPSRLGQAAGPHFVLLGGQPGAGKTGLLLASAAELAETGPTVLVVGDDLRGFHPAFLAFQAADPEAASRFTQADAGIWAEKLFRAALERRVNIVFESTMRNPDNVARVLAAGREAGYQVEGRVIACSPRESWQGCHHRFEEMLVAGAAARMPPREIHDTAVAGLKKSLERIERDQLVDRIQIRLRSGAVVYGNVLVDGKWTAPAAVAVELDKGRDRPLTGAEMDAFVDRWASVLRRMEDRGARPDLIDDARAQSRDDIAWFVMLRDRANFGQADREAGDLSPGFQLDPQRVYGPQPTPVSTVSAVTPSNLDERGQILVPGRELPDLSPGEVNEKMAQSSRLAEKRTEIERLAILVYGNAQQVSSTVQAIDGAGAGDAAADEIRSGRAGPLAGEEKRFLRPESPARQTAKAYLPQLAAAMEDYGRTVDFERHQIDVRHREEQQRQRQEIRAPSQELSAALRAPQREHGDRLQAAPHLRAELDRFSISVHRRLNVDERRSLKDGDVGMLSRQLSVSTSQAAALVSVHAQAQTMSRQARAQRESLERVNMQTIKR